VLCALSGCILNNTADDDTQKKMISPNSTITTPMVTNRDNVIAIALNDTEVRDYIQEGYEIKNVGRLCYISAPGDGKEYELCFPTVEIETKNVYLTVYVDSDKRVVNHTATMYIRSPLIVPEGTKPPAPQVSDS
jgi:hypothetical protein